MAANASAHKLRIEIGSEDWSRSLVSFDAGQDQRSNSGLILTTGTLELGNVIGIPGSLNPRSADGRNRWWRGQLVEIWVTDSTGTEVKHRHGHLYILKAPLPPQNGILRLELGCILSLRNFAQPDDDKSGVVPGNVTNRTAIVNSLLSAAGCPNCVDAIDDYPLRTRQPKQGGSYVDQAGQIAFGGLKSLYQDGNGLIRAVSNRLNYGGSSTAIEIGHDEVSYEASEGSETPCEVIKCVGVLKKLTDNWGTEENFSEEYGPASVVNPSAGSDIILLRRVETKETRNEDGKQRTELIVAPAGIVSPDVFPRSLEIVLDSYTEEEHRYEDFGQRTTSPIDGPAGEDSDKDAPKLWQILTTIRRFFSVAAPEYFEALSAPSQAFWRREVIIANAAVFEYKYTKDELVEKTTRTTREPRSAIVGAEETQFPINLDISEIETVEYQRKNPRVGKIIETLIQVVARAFPNLEPDEGASALDRLFQKLALITKSRKVRGSDSGQCNPPQAERKPERWSEEEEPIEAETRFAIAPLDALHQERERVIQLDVGVVSKQQLGEIAQIKGVELIGQAQGITLQLPLLDLFLSNWSPFIVLDVIEPDGTALRVLTNGIQISHDPNQAIVGFTGIWLGTGKIGQPDRFEAPYYSVTVEGDLAISTPPILNTNYRGGARGGGTFSLLPYSPQTYSNSYRGGAKSGGRTTISDTNFPDGLVVDEFDNPVVDEFGNFVVIYRAPVIDELGNAIVDELDNFVTE
ncbi:hypothetical protein NIES2135_53310 [Leptolyngbya boryana NIES-2135]|jgi:hypothetical protein|uniref:Uncharacterized protein n=1 Tax=Leptolyngbya boryana NIES-2135 TaxID=1973484 RepID=A0A1Z4JP91_LEPBY|nr:MULTISPECIES: hypothetical protein [Leptolyngbya]BAY58458.1 hypothetical protein NIES2135_53310 [Leptolyngbya boryana NIES-2135]MBD2370931.1 hypothetical protein [Leptolyngbya sp. FACHB-161]MBD2377445.1 hypothetical protein [Leptolyngbya sp. FACHB-238]MBD2401853.1 hypothetical protein [Leptolyngbya sp. FACHB-239]MBD2408371.1 hypothetical protein [Leptolyngbya sp. FACHB-402]